MNNKKKAEFYCYIAKTYINRYSDLGDKNLLLESVDFYNEAIRFDSECVDAYIGLAYLEYAYGNTKNAYMLLNKARMIEPVNIKVNMIRQLIKREFNL